MENRRNLRRVREILNDVRRHGPMPARADFPRLGPGTSFMVGYWIQRAIENNYNSRKEGRRLRTLAAGEEPVGIVCVCTRTPRLNRENC